VPSGSRRTIYPRVKTLLENRRLFVRPATTGQQGWRTDSESLVDGVVATPDRAASSVSPDAILHPWIVYRSSHQDYEHHNGPTVTLHRGLRLLRQALDRLVQLEHAAYNNNNNNNNNNNKLYNSNTTHVDHAILERYRDETLLRIQVPLESPVDTLGWLSAQQEHRTRENDHDHQHDCDNDVAFYLANQEQTLETSCVGSVRTFHDTADLWNHTLWSQLPKDSHVYGGARFDPHVPVADEWSAFGQAFWFLPAVELRTTTDPNTNQTVTTLAVHVLRHANDGTWTESARTGQAVLSRLTDRCLAPVPPTTLPPVLSRDSNYGTMDGQELYEGSVGKALDLLRQQQASEAGNATLQKVVLARKQTVHVNVDDWSALHVLRRWKYGGHDGGHLFWLRPGRRSSGTSTAASGGGRVAGVGTEFFGCTPERLFSVSGTTLRSEALAGTRPRGSTPDLDAELLRDLFASPKDRHENRLTGRYIEKAFQNLADARLVRWESPSETDEKRFFVRRLLHLQHICQGYTAELTDPANLRDVAERLLTTMHPTPAVCGVPLEESRQFIRDHEAIGFDRGFYAGPIGYIGRESTEIMVAIRSGLVSHHGSKSSLALYAGGGIVAGSSLQNEWAEINYKFGVISSVFPQSPITLSSAPTPNAAWATAFIEELMRHGVTKFYVCPGSRSTPLVVAIAKAVRTYVGVVHAVSVHDERAAGFRALGYGRGSNCPAAIITSSGTAVSNLYPAIVEAGMDGVPVLVLTADRPYESRDTGANQAIDQVKHFSSTYIRWFRDILPPSDDVPVSVALSDAGHAVSLAKGMRGPVHVNIQFRENLAPDAGPIRNDRRGDAETRYNGFRFTDVPGFGRWSTGGDVFTKYLSSVNKMMDPGVVRLVASMIQKSKRGIIVVGNLRGSDGRDLDDQKQILAAISEFAELIGFPIFAGVQAARLRFMSSAVVPFAEHLLKCAIVKENVQPDLILQIGAPLVSTEITGVIEGAMKNTATSARHVLLHPHTPHERMDPGFTVSHCISTDISPFLKSVSDLIERDGSVTSSELAPLVLLGRGLRDEMKHIILDVAETTMKSEDNPMLTEPEIILALAEDFEQRVDQHSLFLSNSMPIRDAECFLYPFTKEEQRLGLPSLQQIGTNRGASGIDGIISSAFGFSESIQSPTTLVIGDLATLHDVSSLHSLATDMARSYNQARAKKRSPLTTIVVNNDGGGIFSFLPIAQHGNDVAFDEFFGTPTNSFSFEKGAEAFGLTFDRATDYSSFRKVYTTSQQTSKHRLIEARVAGRAANVAIHRGVTKRVETLIGALLKEKAQKTTDSERLSIKQYSVQNSESKAPKNRRTLVLLHGWMGEKTDWDEVADELVKRLGQNWTVISVDLPGHGSSPFGMSSDIQAVKAMLRYNTPTNEFDYSINGIAATVLTSLREHHNLESIDAIGGYSLGGRVALAMKAISLANEASSNPIIHSESRTILLSTFPGAYINESRGSVVPEAKRKIWETSKVGQGEWDENDRERIERDDRLARKLSSIWLRTCLQRPKCSNSQWTDVLNRWYDMPLWGRLSQKGEAYHLLQSRRAASLSRRGRDIAEVLACCSPPRNKETETERNFPKFTLYVAGELDKKYSDIGKSFAKRDEVQYIEISDAGHALLTEVPNTIANIFVDALTTEINAASLAHGDSQEIERQESDKVFAVAAEAPPTIDRRQPLLIEKGRSADLGTTRGETPNVGIAQLNFEGFSIDLVDKNSDSRGIAGVGWDKEADAKRICAQRQGFILEMKSESNEVAIGEVSPLRGLHSESLEDARKQLSVLQSYLVATDDSGHLFSSIPAESVLSLRGELSSYLDKLAFDAGAERLLASVRFGLETAMLNVAAQAVRLPLHQALLTYANMDSSLSPDSIKMVRVSGFVSRGSISKIREGGRRYESLKVKVGYQNLMDDSNAMFNAFQYLGSNKGGKSTKIRVDANRAWNDTEAMEFASALDGIELHAINKIEFIEEPLLKHMDDNDEWSLEGQVESLERWFHHTGIMYALDESVSDLVQSHEGSIHSILPELEEAFKEGNRGCRAVVLKPALVGVERSAQIARLVRSKLGLGVIFSSSFDSGIGLTYTAMLGALSDSHPSRSPPLAHGVGTFEQVGRDTLSPPFDSYVNEQGQLNIASLARAFYGLSLNDISESLNLQQEIVPARSVADTKEESYEASTSTSSSGKEISVVVTLPLPFSAEIACSRFTDLPQQPRWSPWITSVVYQGTESQWKVNVRGISLTWKAISQVVEDPWPGISWESVSGLTNRGIVEFVPDSETSCLMNVRMAIVPPRILQPLFRGTSVFIEDFLRDKLLKWSLEMFRDVVKGDLALERGDVELGDALFGAVEGKASAIEATLNTSPGVNGDDKV
jgi:2-succinyl-5-enolpyruvyl-6-hydroxy-3-cyclohexene-1-carboxylate synthase